MTTQEDVKQLKVDLQKQMDRCPASLRSCSHDYAVKFKRAWAAAHRTLHSERTTRQAVSDALRALQAFGE